MIRLLGDDGVSLPWSGKGRTLRLASLDDAEQARAALRSAGDALASALAHELVQPLASLMLNVDTAVHVAATTGDRESNAQLEGMLGEIQRDVRRTADLVDGLRNIYLGRAVSVRPVDVNAVVTTAALAAEARATACGARMSLDLGDGLPPVTAHEVLIREVVVILLNNAIEAISGSPASPRRVVVSTRQQHGRVEIVVKDTGPGIEPAVGARLFRERVTTKAAGSGIGLSVARRIAAAHGGALEVRHTSRRGTAMAVVLPWKRKWRQGRQINHVE